MRESSIWVQLETQEEIEELQNFALQLLEEGLGGEIRLKAYVKHLMVKDLPHIYNLSEDALVPLYEKYGEENVKLVEPRETDYVEPEYTERLDPLDRIADALERISDNLDLAAQSLEVLEQLSEAVQTDRFGTRLYTASTVSGNIHTY